MAMVVPPSPWPAGPRPAAGRAKLDLAEGPQTPVAGTAPALGTQDWLHAIHQGLQHDAQGDSVRGD
eukprot:3336293-Prorocentrum_lima.AAC.1